MRLEKLHLKNFRNFEELTVSLAPGISVFVASNGSGKTSILESIYYLSQLTSHKMGDNETLIRTSAAVTQIIAKVVAEGAAELLEVQIPRGGRRTLAIDRATAGQPRNFRNRLRVVLFAPEDLDLVRGEASTRRDQLDQLSATHWSTAASTRSSFDKALKQRNSLLKEIQKTPGRDRNSLLETLIDWNDSFLETAAELIVCRNNMLTLQAPRATELYRVLTNNQDELSLTYRPKSVFYEDLEDKELVKANLGKALREFHEIELIRGVTLVGPHRDDIEININGLPSRTHASQGEAWSVALVWRVASFDLLSERYGTPPVLLLDDVFTQLDEKRRELLVSRFPHAEQVLITTAVASDVPAGWWNHSFEIKEGEVVGVS